MVTATIMYGFVFHNLIQVERKGKQLWKDKNKNKGKRKNKNNNRNKNQEQVIA